MSMQKPASGSLLVTVVLPCLNEADSVGRCVDEARQALETASMNAEILVVDNNSTDNSADVARSHGARVIFEPSPGYGSALRAGILAAFGEIVVMADADLTYDLSKIARLIKPVMDGSADLVLGERLSEAPASTMPFLHRKLGTPTLTYLVKRATHGLTVSDSQSGYRAFRRTEIIELGLTSTGMEFASEMLIRAGRKGLRVTETSTGYRERVGESKLNTVSDGWRHLRQILLLAPQIMLITPGVVLLLIGCLLQVFELAVPSGLVIGSLRWQPSFISGIALVIGLQALLAGLVIADRHRALFEAPSTKPRSTTSLASICLVVGIVIAIAGIGIDAALFALWLQHGGSVSREIALAALAQSLVIDGVSMIGFGLLLPVLGRSWQTPDSAIQWTESFLEDGVPDSSTVVQR
jgi:glycosyltransferase involved in cell wall biosynthesis